MARTKVIFITADVERYESPVGIMENLPNSIPPVDNILQCWFGVMALTTCIINTGDLASDDCA